MAGLNPKLQTWLSQLRVAADAAAGRAGLPQWLIDHTRHPVNSRTQNWSFEDHEYQIGLATCDHPHMVVKKAAQIGVTELSYRLVLALMNLYPGTNWIYVMPAIGFARKVSTSRILPAIQASPYLKEMLCADPDSAELRRLGDSFLFMAGAQSMRQAISVPAKGVIRDEFDFCVQSVLTAFKSRLEHNKSGEEILIDFSTPTIGDYGISKLYEQGDQRMYLCYHNGCGNWTVVDPLYDIVLPGFDDALVNLEKADLASHRVEPDKAWVRCQQCQGPISIDNLRDPARRAWVAKNPQRKKIASFYVSPLDVPAIKTPQRIITNILDYDRKQDWVNYGLGKEFTNADNSVIPAALEQHANAVAVEPREGAVRGAYGGLDIGKQCHGLVLKPAAGKLDVVWAERVSQAVRADGTDEVSETMLERMRQYGMYRFVCDAGPDVTIPKRLIAGARYQQAWACEFLNAVKKGKLDILYPDPVTQVVQAVRTQIIDTLVKELNGGVVRLPRRHPEYEILKAQCAAMKRVKRINDRGDTVVAWVATGENHYFMALLYARIGYEMFSANSTVVPLPGAFQVSRARVGADVRQTGVKDYA